ncbi:addiction module protein [Prosthecobacter sp.]|jgi:putative addiction module component (TIGR02574 family)|uniref:addiction module protein n=1 Tax=Prosthecobacter sp. TaxID=1965333 RepID=UPI0037CA7C3B
MILETMPVVQQLSSRDKRLLAEELWKAADAEDAEVMDEAAVLQLLDRRLADHEATPEALAAWEEVKSRIMEGREN